MAWSSKSIALLMNPKIGVFLANFPFVRLLWVLVIMTLWMQPIGQLFINPNSRPNQHVIGMLLLSNLQISQCSLILQATLEWFLVYPITRYIVSLYSNNQPQRWSVLAVRRTSDHDDISPSTVIEITNPPASPANWVLHINVNHATVRACCQNIYNFLVIFSASC